MSETQGYSLFTTTRYDEGLTKLSWNADNGEPSPFLLLRFHFQRLVNAARDHEWPEAQATLQEYEHFKNVCITTIEGYKKSNDTEGKALRLRVAIDRQGIFHPTCSPVAPFTMDPSILAHGDLPSDMPGNIIQIRLDRAPTTPSLFTRTKTTVRGQYEEARARSGIPPLLSPQGPNFEVLLIDKENHILETSIYNIAFRRSGRWLTPNAKYGCLPGVFRRFLLAEGLIDEDQNDTIVVNDVKDGEYVILCNGAQGCRLGKICLNEQNAQ